MLLADLLTETDLRQQVLALYAKLPARWRNEDGSISSRNPRFTNWLATRPDDALPELKAGLEELLARPKTKVRTPPRHARAELATLKLLLQRSGPRFGRWLRELYADDAAALAQCQAEPACMLDLLSDYLQDKLGMTVRRDGLLEFNQLYGDVERMIGALPVALFHFTSSRLLRSIRQHGLEGDREPVNDRITDGVYVTTEQSGPAVAGYIGRARAMHGGNGVMLTIKCYLSELSPDPDDADISTGRTQFMLDDVSPERIVAVDRVA